MIIYATSEHDAVEMAVAQVAPSPASRAEYQTKYPKAVKSGRGPEPPAHHRRPREPLRPDRAA